MSQKILEKYRGLPKKLYKHKETVPKCDHQIMVKPLITCLTDKKSEIRVMSEEMIVQVIC